MGCWCGVWSVPRPPRVHRIARCAGLAFVKADGQVYSSIFAQTTRNAPAFIREVHQWRNRSMPQPTKGDA